MWRHRSLLLCRGGVTANGNVDRMGRDIAAAFGENGWRVLDFPRDGGDVAENLRQIASFLASGDFDVMLSVQDMGHIRGDQANGLLAKGGVRRLYWALDHPYSCWGSIASLPAGSIVTYPTLSNLACCARHLRHDVALRCMAHAAAPREPAAWQDRDIAVLFVGNLPRPLPDEMRRGWRREHGEPWASLLEEMAERFDPLATASLDRLAEEIFGARGMNLDRVRFFTLLREFDNYAWARTRLDYALALRDAPVTFVGAGWEDLVGPAARTLGPLPSGEARTLMARARAVLNILPAYYRSHERVFEGMAAGAAVLSTGAGYLANARGIERDEADREAIAYLGPPADAEETLRDLAGDEAKLRRIAERGLDEQRARHTWTHRVAALLASLEPPTAAPAVPPATGPTAGQDASPWRNRSIMLVRANISHELNLDRLGSALLDGFRQCGWTAHEFDLSEGDPKAKLAASMAMLMGGRIDLILTLLGMGEVSGGEGELARAGAQRLCWDVNHPYSMADYTASLPPGTLVCYTTASNLDCCRRHIRDDLRLHLLAHAAAVAQPLPWAERDIPALFIGNIERPLPDEMRRGWPAQMGTRWSAVLEAMAARFRPESTEPLESLAQETLVGQGVTVISRRDFFMILQTFDAYARALTRLDYGRALRGLPVMFVGRGWDDVAEAPGQSLGPLPSQAARALMRRARLVLNILPAYYRSHERVFEGMAVGAAVASTGGSYLANACGTVRDEADDRAIAYLGSPAEASLNLRALLAHEAALRRLADAGLEEQRARHTWRHRIAALLASLDAAS